MSIDNNIYSYNNRISNSTQKKTILDDNDIKQFKQFGYVVKRNLFSNKDDDNLLTEHQIELRKYLANNAGIIFDEKVKIGSAEESDMLRQQESKMSNVSTGFGGMVNFYHGQAMYKIREHPSLYHAFTQLYDETYSNSTIDSKEWPNGYHKFNPEHMYMFVNRCGFRIPFKTSEDLQEKQESKPIIQKGTGTHLDCNPFHLFKGEKAIKENGTIELVPLRFWQPIQAFVALSDTVEPGNGGFWCVPEFHHRCIDYFKEKYSEIYEKIQNNSTLASSTTLLKRGNAFDLSIDTDPEIFQQLQHIPMRRGDVIFWDWRLPHCNDEVHRGTSIREVVYSAHLPAVDLNQSYASDQYNWYKRGVHPSYVSKQFSTLESINYQLPELTSLGRLLMDVDKWDFNKEEETKK